MPLKHSGISSLSGNLANEAREQIDKVFDVLDQQIVAISRERGLRPEQVRLLQPLHCCVIVEDQRILVVLSVSDIGAMSIRDFQDWSNKPPLDLPAAIHLVERDLHFKSAFGFEMSRSVLNSTDDHSDDETTAIASQVVAQEVEHMDRLNRIVKIDPIFQGRDFLRKDNFVFVLSPFGDPFDTIYSDHIKPTVESIGGLVCSRADDIYDNRPIIEDIWRCTHEARLLISELTDRNANVFYETGIAHTIGKEVVLITQSMADVPFDLKHLRCIVYEYTPKGATALEQNLQNTVQNILARGE